MKNTRQTLDTSRLFGFEHVECEIDLSDPALSGRIGAKVGTPEPVTPDTTIDTSSRAD